MNLKDRANLLEVVERMSRLQSKLRWLGQLPFPELMDGLAQIETLAERITERGLALLQDSKQIDLGPDVLSHDEITRLLQMNERLGSVGNLLQQVAHDVTPRLEAKLADHEDSMYDYEIEVRIDYQLREDDPEYSEKSDNFLTSRHYSAKIRRSEGFDNQFRRYIGQPDALHAVAHCRLFHDLYDHGYGPDQPRLSFRDCLRIGSAFVDVQIWQQYRVDIEQ